MSTLCLNFQAHQPFRMGNYDFFKIGEHAFYEDDELNTRVLNDLSERCYLPANRLMLQLIELSEGSFKINLALSGVFLEQCFNHRPDVIESFKDLVATGAVELLAMPYYASFSSVFSDEDFQEEVIAHRELCRQLFGQEPVVLWNTALAYSDHIAYEAEQLGLKGLFADSVDYVLKGESRCALYRTPGTQFIKTLVRHDSLSTDLEVRRTDEQWSAYPLSGETFSSWLKEGEGRVISLCLDYEALGDKQREETGVFEFWQEFVHSALGAGHRFVNASAAVEATEAKEVLCCPHVTTKGTYHTTHDWLSNVLQNEAITKIYQIEKNVKNCADPDLLHTWRKLQSADHFFYMSELGQDYSPFPSPYDMYISYMNALADLQVRVGRVCDLS